MAVLRSFSTSPIVGTIVTVLVAALLFGVTLQTDINGSNDFHMDDAGEFQVAWNTWGVAHPPGYPLINLAANILTHLIRLFGVRPALAASLFSMVLGLAALSVLYHLLLDRTGNPWISAAATLLLAVSHLFWINSSIAEVYTLGMLFAVLILWMALRLEPEQSERTIFALSLILGLAVGHHRTLLLLLIPLVPLLLPAWRSIRPRYAPDRAGSVRSHLRCLSLSAAGDTIGIALDLRAPA